MNKENYADKWDQSYQLGTEPHIKTVTEYNIQHLIPLHQNYPVLVAVSLNTAI